MLILFESRKKIDTLSEAHKQLISTNARVCACANRRRKRQIPKCMAMCVRACVVASECIIGTSGNHSYHYTATTTNTHTHGVAARSCGMHK